MKHFLFFRNDKVYILLFVFLLPFLISCTSVSVGSGAEPLFIEHDKAAAVFTDNLPMQIEQTFPIPLKDYDASILPNNYISFVAYKGQAHIYFLATHIKSFTLYINNRKIESQKICTDRPVCMDASPYITNGTNILYIAAIVPRSSEEKENDAASLQVKIPFPVIRPVQTQQIKTGYSQTALEITDQLLTAETEYGFPGAQLVIVKNGEMIKSSAYGVISRVDGAGEILDKPLPVTAETLFDIASNTKMYAANFAVQKLISEEKLFLTDTVQKFFPQFTDGVKDKIKGKSVITVFDLLTHQSGFPAGHPYSKKIAKLKNNTAKSNRQHTLDLIMKTPLVYQPHSSALYSDVNYILLTHIIEKITGMTLDDYIYQSFYRPLNLDRICFTPLQKGFSLEEIAATEIDAPARTDTRTAEHRKELIHGTVHDEEGYTAMEQISGHAGLFANAESLAVLAQVMLNGGGYGTWRFFEPAVTGYFTVQQSLISSIGLGWRRQGKQEYSWAFSPLASEQTFGHTGWTGTLTLIDPNEQLIIILLTNAKNTMPAHSSRKGRFEGDYYLVKRYGAIITLIYEAFRNPPPEKLDSILIELAEKKYEMLLEIKAFDNDGYINDMAAIISTISLRAPHSTALRQFLQSKTATDIFQLLHKNT